MDSIFPGGVGGATMLRLAMDEAAQLWVLLPVIGAILQVYKGYFQTKQRTIQIFTSGLWRLFHTVTDRPSLEIATSHSNSKTNDFISEVDEYLIQC